MHTCHFQLQPILEALTNVGATSVPILTEEFRHTLSSVAKSYSYQKQQEIVGSGDRLVRQQLASFQVFCKESSFRQLQQTFQALLEQSLTQTNPYPFATPLNLNAMVLQKYEKGSIGITPHRDRQRNINLICIFVLEGQGRFFVCKDRTGNNPTEIDATPGNVIFLRASGFRRVDKQEIRPFHFVSDIQTTRYTLGLRQLA